MRISIFTGLFFLIASVVSAASDEVKPPTANSCEIQLVNQRLSEGKLAEALAQEQRCLSYYESQSGSSLGYPGLNDLDIHGALSSIAQIYALSGDVDHAGVALLRAEDFAAYKGYLNSARYDSGSAIAGDKLTRGFIHERRGEIDLALEDYSSSAADGRIALVALKQKDDGKARLYATKAALAQDPTGEYVLGSLSEISGDSAEAWDHYSLAQQMIRKQTNDQYRNPLLFSESQEISAALNRIPGYSSKNRIEVREGLKTYFDSSGTIVGKERWPGALMLETVRRKQELYNTWMDAEAKNNSLPNIRLVSQYPRQFLAVDAGGATYLDHPEISEIRVPRDIEPTGVLDLDTLAIDFYKSAIEWTKLCAAAGVNNQALVRLMSEKDFTQSAQVALNSTLAWQLGRTYVALDKLRHFLSGVAMHASAGEAYDAVTEAQKYEINLALLNKSSDAARSDSPPNFMTAHIDPRELTPAFIDELRVRESDISADLFLAREMLSAKTP